MPGWASEVYPSPMQNLTGQYYKEYYAGSDEAVRLLVGKLTYCLIQNQIIKNQIGTVKNRELFLRFGKFGVVKYSLYIYVVVKREAIFRVYPRNYFGIIVDRFAKNICF